MSAAVTLTLALCAALTAATHNNTTETTSQCNKNAPNMQISVYYFDDLYEYTVYFNANGQDAPQVSIPYGAKLKVWCSGSKDEYIKRLIMTKDGERLRTTAVNLLGILWLSKKVYSEKSEYIFQCIDVKIGCARSVTTMITPRLEVVTPDVLGIGKEESHISYTVGWRESMLVLCSGPHAARLVLVQDGKTLPTTRENDTTIKFVRETDEPFSQYVCTDVNTSYNNTMTVEVLPGFHFTSENERITPYLWFYDHFDYNWRTYCFEHRPSIEVYCSGPRAVQLIEQRHEDTYSVESFNQSTVKLVKIAKSGKSDFSCRDSKFMNYVNEVRVVVTPRMEVNSPNLRRVRHDNGIQYGIKYGDPLEIICSDADSRNLVIRNNKHYDYFDNDDHSIGVQQTINETAIKYVIMEANLKWNVDYECYNANLSERKRRMLVARVAVAPLPADVLDFRCVSHDGKYLNFSWTAPSDFVNFTLSFVEDGILTRICDKQPSTRRSKFCVWDYEYDFERRDLKVLTLRLQFCNKVVGCSNQSFHIDHLSVVKPAPPRGITLRNATSRGAVLEWPATSISVANKYLADARGSFFHKVQYRYSSMQAKEVNSSLVICDYDVCKIELDLPCPGQVYEVQIYQKYNGAVGEEMWSDPSTAIFQTQDDDTTIADLTCNYGPRKTKEVMLYFVQVFRKNIRDDLKPMKKVIRSLRDKLANIRKYLQTA